MKGVFKVSKFRVLTFLNKSDLESLEVKGFSDWTHYAIQHPALFFNKVGATQFSMVLNRYQNIRGIFSLDGLYMAEVFLSEQPNPSNIEGNNLGLLCELNVLNIEDITAIYSMKRGWGCFYILKPYKVYKPDMCLFEETVAFSSEMEARDNVPVFNLTSFKDYTKYYDRDSVYYVYTRGVMGDGHLHLIVDDVVRHIPKVDYTLEELDCVVKIILHFLFNGVMHPEDVDSWILNFVNYCYSHVNPNLYSMIYYTLYEKNETVYVDRAKFLLDLEMAVDAFVHAAPMMVYDDGILNISGHELRMYREDFDDFYEAVQSLEYKCHGKFKCLLKTSDVEIYGDFHPDIHNLLCLKISYPNEPDVKVSVHVEGSL